MLIILAKSGLAGAQTAVNADDRGWYNAAGTHNSGNNNSYTGLLSGTEYRSYFRFAIPSGVICVSSAILELELENYYGSGPGHTATLFDVSPGNVPNLDVNNGGGSGPAIYTDLGSGATYGSLSGLSAADVGSVLSFSLSPAAYADIAAASGGDFAIGNVTVPSGTGNLRALRYSAGSETRTHRLIYTPCVFPDLEASKSVEVYDPLSLGLYAVPGNDVIYTITVSNAGPGSVDADAMFLVDKIPDEVEFYVGDIDDAGPQSDPVAFTQTASGLTFTYGTDIGYSDAATPPADFAACTYTPPAGYDAAGNVKYICINPKGAFAGGSPAPEFAISFRVRIK